MSNEVVSGNDCGRAGDAIIQGYLEMWTVQEMDKGPLFLRVRSVTCRPTVLRVLTLRQRVSSFAAYEATESAVVSGLFSRLCSKNEAAQP